MPAPIPLEYTEDHSIIWKVPVPYVGRLRLCAREAGGPCSATFTFTDPELQAQIEHWGADLFDDLARPDGIELRLDRKHGMFTLTVNNVKANAGRIVVRVECWDPPNAAARRFPVDGGASDSRVVMYSK